MKYFPLCRSEIRYLYEYMENWAKFNETSLSEKKFFYSYVIMKDITAAVYTLA